MTFVFIGHQSFSIVCCAFEPKQLSVLRLLHLLKIVADQTQYQRPCQSLK